jgi:hypothetical protein
MGCTTYAYICSSGYSAEDTEKKSVTILWLETSITLCRKGDGFHDDAATVVAVVVSGCGFHSQLRGMTNTTVHYWPHNKLAYGGNKSC